MGHDVSVLAYFSEFFLVSRIAYKVLAFVFLSLGFWCMVRKDRLIPVMHWMDQNRRLLLWAIFTTGLGLRLAWVWMSPHMPSSDEVDLLGHSKDLAQGRGFQEAGVPVVYRSIGYCVFLSFFYGTTSAPEAWIRFANAALSASVCFPMYFAGREIRGVPLGIAACCTWALYPVSVVASSIVLDEHMCLPLFLFGLYFAIVYARSPKTRYLITSGICLGVGALARPLPFLMPAAIFLFFWACRFSFLRSFTNAALVGFVILLCATPWAIRNWIQVGSPVLYSRGEDGFYWANNAVYDVKFPVNPKPSEGEDPELTRARTLMTQGGEGQLAYSRVSTKKAWQWITENPGMFLKKTAGKSFRLLGFSEEEWAVAINFSRTFPGKEISEASPMRWGLIKLENWTYVLIFFSFLGGLVFFFIQWFQRKVNIPLILVLLAGGEVFLITVLYLAHLKYRYMLEPIFILTGCYYFLCLASIYGSSHQQESVNR